MLCHVLLQAWRRVRTSGAAAKPPVRGHTSMPAPETGAVERALPNGRHDARPRAWITIHLRRASGRMNRPGARPRQRQWTRHHDGFPHLRHTPIEGRVTLSEAGLLARGSSSGTAFPTGIHGPPVSGSLAPTRRSQLRGQPRLASGSDACRFRRSLLISRLAPGRTADNACRDRGRLQACQPLEPFGECGPVNSSKADRHRHVQSAVRSGIGRRRQRRSPIHQGAGFRIEQFMAGTAGHGAGRWRPHHRRAVEGRRFHLRPLHTRRMLELSQARWVRVRLNARNSRSRHFCPCANYFVHVQTFLSADRSLILVTGIRLINQKLTKRLSPPLNPIDQPPGAKRFCRILEVHHGKRNRRAD